MKRLSIISLVLVASVSHAGLLDDFTTGAAYSTGYQSTVGTTTAYISASAAPGGIRTTSLTVVSTIDEGSSRLRVVPTSGRFLFSSDTGVDTQLLLRYGFAGGSSDPGSSPANLDLSATQNVQLSFFANDQALPITAKIWTNGNANLYTKSLVFGALPSGTTGIATFDFSGLGDLTDVDAIAFEFDPASGADFTLTTVSTVPEPASIAGLALGLVAIARRKKK